MSTLLFAKVKTTNIYFTLGSLHLCFLCLFTVLKLVGDIRQYYTFLTYTVALLVTNVFNKTKPIKDKSHIYFFSKNIT